MKDNNWQVLAEAFIDGRYAWSARVHLFDLFRLFWAWMIRRKVDGRFLIDLRWETGTRERLKRFSNEKV